MIFEKDFVKMYYLYVLNLLWARRHQTNTWANVDQLWPSPKGNLTEICQDICPWYEFEND